MKDVARESGVSLATVSKVINGLPVGKASRQKVEFAIEKLGYHVNPYARALKSSRTYSIALVMPSLKHPFFAHMTDELIKCLMHKGYRCVLMITNYDPRTEQKCFEMVQSNKADGIIALTYSPNLELSSTIPIVTIDRHIEKDVPCVSSDNYRGGEIAAEKLLELGCHKLLFMRIASEITGEPDKRLAGFENICLKRNIEYKTLLLNEEDSDDLIKEFLLKYVACDSPEYDGIFCNSDSLAGKTRLFLQHRGIQIPEQVQIIGYDGIIDHFANKYVCSTIKQPLPLMAQTAVDILFNEISSSPGLNVCLPVEYIPGDTTRD